MSVPGDSAMVAVALVAAACGGDASGTSSDTGNDESAGGTTSETGSGDDAGMLAPPATFRVECIDILELGDADGTALQAQVLENAWAENIARFDFSILVGVIDQDLGSETANYEIASGLGRSNEELCSVPETVEGPLPGVLEVGVVAFGAGDDCSAPADASDPRAVTYEVVLGPEDVLWAYSEQDDGQVLNCTIDPATQDGVPMRALQARFTAVGSRVYGELAACLLQSEGLELCTCLVDCKPDADVIEGCEACPVSSAPLIELIQGINPSDRCTGIMGAPAYDLALAFTGRVLPSVPPICG